MLIKLFLVAILVGVCAARCDDEIIGGIGSIPCKPITPGFGTPGIGGGAGGFNGLASQYVADSGTRRPLLAQLFGSNNDDEEQGGGLTSVHQTSG